jgi:hypothetical protein
VSDNKVTILHSPWQATSPIFYKSRTGDFSADPRLALTSQSHRFAEFCSAIVKMRNFDSLFRK